MKKIYLTPELLVVKIQTSGMLAVSGFNEVLDDLNPGDGGDALTREFDELEEDEYNEEEDDFAGV